MKMRILLLSFGLAISSATYAQNNIFAFFEYDLKDGHRDQFINGYAKDLSWHQSQGDDWTWVGWFVTNGPRRGRFIDATPNHNWSDFDRWKVDAAENARNNDIHWAPYVDNASGSYKKVLTDYSNSAGNWFVSPNVQVYSIEIKPGKELFFEDFLKDFSPLLKEQLRELPFVWMKTISGAKTNEYLLYVGMDKIEQLAACEYLFHFSVSQKELARKYNECVARQSSELWSYSQKLSLIQRH